MLRYTPWQILQHEGHTRSDANDLDYTELLPHSTLCRSLRRKHFLVSVAVATAVLLKLQVVLSSAIFQLVTTESSDPTDVQILSSFNKSYNFDFDLGNANDLVYSNSQAMQRFDMDFPFGVANGFAYQTFSMQKKKTIRADADAPLSVDVDAIFTEGKCQPLEDYSVSNISLVASDDPTTAPVGILEIDLHFEDCDDSISVNFSAPYPSPVMWSLGNLGDDMRNCSSLPQQHRQLLYAGLHLDWTLDEAEAVRINYLSAAICSTRSYTTMVQVVDDGIRPNVSVVGGREKRSDVDINPWRLLSSLSSHVPQLDKSAGSISTAVGPVIWHYKQQNKYLNASDATLYRSEILVEAFESFSKQFLPFLSHYVLRQDTEGSIEGAMLRPVGRLHANFGVCVTMAVLFATCAFLALFATYDSRKKAVHFYRDPATILGALVHFQSGEPGVLTTTMTPAAATAARSDDNEARKATWSRCTYTPLVLRTSFRAIFVVYLLALIAWLGYSVQRSQQHNGLIFIDDSAYWPLLFQSLPSLAMLLVSLYANAADTNIRSLAILSTISGRPSSAAQLDMSLLDMLGLRALYYSVRYRVPLVTLSQTIAVICAFLPTISSVLLVPQFVPQSSDLMLQQQSHFVDQKVTDDNVDELSDHRETLADFNVMRNLFDNFTYPPGTYYDLVFPTLDLDDPRWAPGVSAEVTTPAAKLRPETCERLSSDDGDFYITKSWLDPNETVPWDPPFNEEFACPNNTRANITSFINLNAAGHGNDAYIGYAFDSGLNPVAQYVKCSGDSSRRNISLERPPWVVQTYVWGKFERSSLDFDHLSVVRCNYSWMDVTAEVALRWSGRGMMIDHSNPPKEDKSSMRPWTPAFNVPIFDDYMVDAYVPSVEDVFNGFDTPTTGIWMRFAAILEPYSSTKLADLGDPEKDDQVLESLHSNLGFVVAQLSNIEQRQDFDNHTKTEAADSTGEELRPVQATLTDARLIRVVQNSRITYALVSVLAVTAIVNIWAIVSQIWSRYVPFEQGRRPWYLLDMEQRGRAPKGFNSIAMTKALIDGSNVPKILPQDAQLIPRRDLHRHLAGKRFSLGWFSKIETGANIFTIAVVDDERLVFLGHSLDAEKGPATEGH